jgi:hypothetical protein
MTLHLESFGKSHARSFRAEYDIDWMRSQPAHVRNAGAKARTRIVDTGHRSAGI